MRSTLSYAAHPPDCGFSALQSDNTNLLHGNMGAPFELHFWELGASGREAVETFIAHAYEREFGAAVGVNFPTLIGLRDRTGRLRAAVGLRMAQNDTLFLEQYLEHSVETTLHHILDLPVGRDAVVELGSFASTGFCMSVYLLGAVSAFLSAGGFEVGVVTATSKVNRLFRIFNLRTQVICPARQEALHDQQTNWGGYYACDPQVIVGSTRQCLAAVLKSVAVQNTPIRCAILASLVSQAAAQA